MGKKYKIGDRCRVRIDWETPTQKAKDAVVVIKSFQKNGMTTFAKVEWLGHDAIELAERYGNLFTNEELRKA
jgi:hypothetical protein